MASKKTTRNGDTVEKGKQLASWRERAMQSVDRQKKQADKLPAGGSDFLSFKGGAITLGGSPIDNPMRAVVLDFQAERAYYSGPYVPDRKESPDCYSFDGSEPHEKARNKQSDRCATCEHNQFGSAANGRGKACKEGMRAVFMSADDVEHADEAKLVQGRLSVTNSRTFDRFVRAIGDSPTWRHIIALSNKTHPTNQYEVGIKVESQIDEELLDGVSARVSDAEAMLSAPYPEFEEAPPAKPQRKFGRGK